MDNGPAHDLLWLAGQHLEPCHATAGTILWATEEDGGDAPRGISFLKTVNTLLSESTEGRTGHKGGRAFAWTCIHHEMRSAEVPKAFFTCTQQVSRSMSM